MYLTEYSTRKVCSSVCVCGKVASQCPQGAAQHASSLVAGALAWNTLVHQNRRPSGLWPDLPENPCCKIATNEKTCNKANGEAGCEWTGEILHPYPLASTVRPAVPTSQR